MTDWRDKFWEVRVRVDVEVEFTVPVKAKNETEAQQETAKLLKGWNIQDYLEHDQYNPVYELDPFDVDQWNVLTGEEAFGWKNTPEDLKEAKEAAWNIKEDKS